MLVSIFFIEMTSIVKRTVFICNENKSNALVYRKEGVKDNICIFIA